jgi:hypothetical protein
VEGGELRVGKAQEKGAADAPGVLDDGLLQAGPEAPPLVFGVDDDIGHEADKERAGLIDRRDELQAVGRDQRPAPPRADTEAGPANVFAGVAPPGEAFRDRLPGVSLVVQRVDFGEAGRADPLDQIVFRGDRRDERGRGGCWSHQGISP